jgi:hypothetical protein
MKLTISGKIAFVSLIITCLFSCKSNNQDNLFQKWQTVAIQNHKMDDEIKKMKDYIDTVGNLDQEIHKATDVTLLKKELQAELEKNLSDQKLAFENTFMEFTSNFLMITTSIEGIDSAMYKIEDPFIKVDDAKLKGYGESMTFEILSLTKDTLKLKLIDYGDTSIATMIPVKK